MSEAAIRAGIKTKVEAVSNVGQVYDYERWATEWSAFLDLFKTTIGGSDVIRGWTITCQSFPQEQVTFGDPGGIDRTYTYKLRGYFGLDDSAASEKAAMVVAEDVVEAFDAEFDATQEVINEPADLTVFEARLFGDVLCHYAEVTLMVTELR